jgi:hypothetical protein
MNQKMIIFEKSNPNLALAKMLIFTFIFTFHFCCSFKLCSNAQSFAINNDTHPPSFMPLPLPQPCHHLPSPLLCPLLHCLTPPAAANQPHQMSVIIWALGNFFKFFSFHFNQLILSFAFSRVYLCYSIQHGTPTPMPCWNSNLSHVQASTPSLWTSFSCWTSFFPLIQGYSTSACYLYTFNLLFIVTTVAVWMVSRSIKVI